MSPIQQPQTKTRLIIVFNHRFDDNISKLEKIYGDKFSSILYLIPGYDGDRKDCIPVFYRSANFHGFFSSVVNYCTRDEFTHYAFVGDDLILNPNLNENNLAFELGLDKEAGYTKSISNLNECYLLWLHQNRTLRSVREFEHGLMRMLPSVETASAAFSRIGLSGEQTLSFRNLRDWYGQICIGDFIKNKRMLPEILRLFRGVKFPYPLAMGYSDFLVVPVSALKKFCYYCGIFAALDLFVEVAAPTSLVLAIENIVTECDIGCKPTMTNPKKGVKWIGVELWEKIERENIEKEHSRSLQRLFSSMKTDTLYIHPIKLSGWD